MRVALLRDDERCGYARARNCCEGRRKRTSSARNFLPEGLSVDFVRAMRPRGTYSAAINGREKGTFVMSNKTYAQIQLETVPERVFPFVRAISTNQHIREAMAAAGYTPAVQAEGWQLLSRATGHEQQCPAADSASAARRAIAELDDWDEGGFRRIHATLERHHPEQDAFVFAGLEATRGPSAVVGVAHLLERLDQLENGSEADKAAIQTLEQRGINRRLREHLGALVAVAQAAQPTDDNVALKSVDVLQQALIALYEWYREWSETARAVIQQRGHLILMGLAKPRNRTSQPTPPAPAEPPDDGEAAAE